MNAWLYTVGKTASAGAIFFALLVVGCQCVRGPSSAPIDEEYAAKRIPRKQPPAESTTPAKIGEFLPPMVCDEPESPVLLVNGTEPASPRLQAVSQQFDLSLSDAIAISLESNPDLAIARASEPVAHAAYHVAKTYPFNPQFQTQVLPYTRDRNGNDAPVSQQHAVVQTFELGGQSRFRSGAAAASWEQTQRTIQQAELLTIAQTERLYFSAMYYDELLAIDRSLAGLNDQLVHVMERRLQAGQASGADVTLARLQAESSRRRLRLVEANYRTALMNLRSYLNYAEDVELHLSEQWADWRWKPVADVLQDSNAPSAHRPPVPAANESNRTVIHINADSLGRIVSKRPDVVAACAAVAAAQENLALAEAMRTPDLQIGPMWQRDDAATQFWGIQAQIDIPVVNNGTAVVGQRQAELQQQQVTAARIEEKARSEARAAIQRYEQARKLVEQSRSEVSRLTPGVLKPFEDQFRAGQISLLEIFAARTSLVQSHQSYLDLLNELAQSAAEVTEATGLPAGQLIQTAANSDHSRTPDSPTRETIQSAYAETVVQQPTTPVQSNTAAKP